MSFFVETWDPSYGSPIEINELDSASESVKVDAEVAVEKWKPISVPAVNLRSSIIFIDGVRRFDAHIWFEDEGHPHRGICATVGAGSVRCTATKAEVEHTRIERAVHTSAVGIADIELPRFGETYKFKATKDDSSEALNMSVQNHMARLEDLISAECEDEELVVFDGPLQQRELACGVGYVKSQHVQYLPDDVVPVLGKLKPGERTPLIDIEGRFLRWSWFLRLADVGSVASSIVRLELPRSLSIEAAVERANYVSALLPRYASMAHKESRAPQNLYPISGLERQLRRRLGSRDLLERGLRLASA